MSEPRRWPAAGTPASETFKIGGDLEVARLGYGAMQLMGEGYYGPPKDPEAALRVLSRAVELGVNHFDTADAYGPDISEQLIHDALHPYTGLTVASKAGLLNVGPTNSLPPMCGHPGYLRQQLLKSLRRLQVEQLDLWYLHRIDPAFPAEEQLAVFAQARQEGLVRHVGLSDVTLTELKQAEKIVPIAAVQNLFNLTAQENPDVLAYCEQQQIAFVTFFPLGSGQLAGPGGPLARIAQRHGATAGQIALAWQLHRSPAMLTIPGTRSLTHLEENVAAAEIQLTAQELTDIDAAATQATQ